MSIIKNEKEERKAGRQADGMMKMMMRANNIKLILFFMICVWFATSISFSCSLSPRLASTHTAYIRVGAELKCHRKARADVTNDFTRRATCISIHENPIISVRPQMCFIFFFFFSSFNTTHPSTSTAAIPSSRKIIVCCQ